MQSRVTRKGKFDAGHRVMHERFKCFNLHGHEYHYELEFSYEHAEAIGYAIDFKEIKRVACQWIDDAFDHGFIANPADTVMIEACKAVSSKLYVMQMADESGYCNPSAEMIAKEIFFGVSMLMNTLCLRLTGVRLQETVNCFVDCPGLDDREWTKLRESPLAREVLTFKKKMGVIEYDERKAGASHQ